MNKKRGFTLFIALIVSGMLLAIGFSIGNIVLKQLQLTSSGSESQIAFYAADSASECALYWDRKTSDGSSVFDTEFGTSTTVTQMTPMFCGASGTSGNAPIGKTDGAVFIASKATDLIKNLATTTFYVNYTDARDSSYKACAKVVVFRDDSNDSIHTTIDARGYNASYNFDLSAPGCDVSNPRTVERGLYLRY